MTMSRWDELSERPPAARLVAATVGFLALFLGGQAGLLLAVRHGLARTLGVEVPVTWTYLWSGFGLSMLALTVAPLMAWQAALSLPRAAAAVATLAVVAVTTGVLIHTDHTAAAVGTALRAGGHHTADKTHRLTAAACILTPHRKHTGWIVGPIGKQTVVVNRTGTVEVVTNPSFEFTGDSTSPAC